MSEGIQALAGFMHTAMREGTIPLVIEEVVGATPPPPGFFFVLMRDMVEQTGGATGCVVFGTDDNRAGMVPHDGNVTEVLEGLIALRLSGMFGRVNHVAVGADTWHRCYEPGDFESEGVRHGDLQARAEAGDERVTEALMALCYAPDGPTYCDMQPYTRTEGGIVWGPVEPLPFDRQLGDLPRLMKTLTRA